MELRWFEGMETKILRGLGFPSGIVVVRLSKN
jgi:hypothetical protein